MMHPDLQKARELAQEVEMRAERDTPEKKLGKSLMAMAEAVADIEARVKKLEDEVAKGRSR